MEKGRDAGQEVGPGETCLTVWQDTHQNRFKYQIRQFSDLSLGFCDAIVLMIYWEVERRPSIRYTPAGRPRPSSSPGWDGGGGCERFRATLTRRPAPRRLQFQAAFTEKAGSCAQLGF